MFGLNVRCIGAVGLALFVGLGIGNYIATKSALEEQRTDLLEYAAQREAAVGEAYAKANIEFGQKLASKMKERDDADQKAHETFQEGLRSAARDRMAAERLLAAERIAKMKELNTNEGLRQVNKQLAEDARRVPGCEFSSNTRRVLDTSVGAAGSGLDPAAGGPAAEASGGVASEAGASPVLTCDQLLSGYLALGQDRREKVSQLNAVLDWIERLGM